MTGQITGEMGTLAIVGISIVFGVLALISIVVALFKKVDDRWKDHEARMEEKATEKEPTIDQTTLVLLSAAAAVAAGGRFRIRRIRRLLPMRTKRTPWSNQGRLILMGSHTINRKSKRGQR